MNIDHGVRALRLLWRAELIAVELRARALFTKAMLTMLALLSLLVALACIEFALLDLLQRTFGTMQAFAMLAAAHLITAALLVFWGRKSRNRQQLAMADELQRLAGSAVKDDFLTFGSSFNPLAPVLQLVGLIRRRTKASDDAKPG